MSFKDKLKDKYSIFSMIIGRRRVGKTALLLQPFEVDKKMVICEVKLKLHGAIILIKN